jgi:hypothetical protein
MQWAVAFTVTGAESGLRTGNLQASGYTIYSQLMAVSMFPSQAIQAGRPFGDLRPTAARKNSIRNWFVL